MRSRFSFEHPIIGALLLVIYYPFTASGEEVSVLEALASSSVRMPCTVLQKAGDGVEFIFWYKNDGVNALYTLDARRRTLAEASHVRNETYGARVRFHADAPQPYLQLDALRLEDAGEYFCRVDYQWSATELTKVHLVVIVPPKKLIIRNESGHELTDIAGPFRERSTITLSCEAQKGFPPPNVTWWRDNKPWDSTWSPYSGGVLNEMKLSNLSRGDLFATFHCKAHNSNLTPPLVSTVVLDMYLYPVSVRITTPSASLRAGRRAELRCETRGSRPAARVAWRLGGAPLSDSAESVGDEGTASALRLLPKPAHHGQPLACVADNERLPDAHMEDVRTLNVTYPPEVSLRLLTEEPGRPPKEDDYVRLVCEVRANPPAGRPGWLLAGRPLHHNQSRTDVVSGNTLVFKRLTRRNKGAYSCFAVNEEGRGVSAELKLNVSHAPVCKEHQQITYAVRLNGTAGVRCEVEAEPPDVTFKWEFSNTVRKHYDLQHTARGTVSTALYRPATPADYGTLFCWANNSVGHQQSSCFFTVIAPACTAENVKLNASSLSREGGEESWTPSLITTGAGVIAFVVIVTAASIFYFRRLYLERKHRPIEPISEEEISIYSRAQYHNTGPQPHILITK